MKKIVFFDIDGTLVSEIDYKLPSSVVKSIEKLKENDVEIFLCTGRNFETTKPIIDQLGVSNYIVSNGQQIFINHKVVHSRYFKEEEKKTYISELNDVAWGYITEDKSYIVNDINKKCENIFKYFVDSLLFATNQEFLSSNVVSLVIVGNDCEKFPIIKENNNMYLWNDDHFQITPIDCNKGIAIDFVRNLYNQEVYCYGFGDSVNDVQMKQYVDYLVAMGNAVDEVKGVADFITMNASDSGIMIALEKLKLI